MHHTLPSDFYQLRNEPEITFRLKLATVETSETVVATRAEIQRVVFDKDQGQPFKYEVIFRNEFSSSKPNFTLEMYESTAVSVLRSQLESKVFRDTRVVLEKISGLPKTEVGVTFDWSLSS
jgi:hypothetical protein